MTPRRRLVSGVTLLLLALGACSPIVTVETTGDVRAPTASPTTVAEHQPSTVPTTPSSTETSSATTVAPMPLPRNAEEYATTAFDAWRAGDEALLTRMMTDDARQRLADGALDPEAEWEFDRCEGATGSSFCTWVGPDGTLTLRVANEAAGGGEDHAVAEVLIAGG